MPTSDHNGPRRTLLLTGASRGIGHATVKRFSAAGWRVITCSRHPFPENCPWEAGPEDHIQVDLSDPANTAGRDRGNQAPAAGRPSACARQQRRHFAEGRRRRAAERDRHRHQDLAARLSGQFLRADHAGARTDERAESDARLGGQRDLDRGLARASVCRRGLCHLEGRARLADTRNGRRFRPARHPRQCHRAGRDRHRDPRRPAPTRSSSSKSRCTGSARRTRSRRSSTCCAPRRRPTCTAPKFTSTAASMCERKT